MKRLVPFTVLAALVLAAPAAAAPASVSVGSFFFKKDYVQVNPGDTVTWTNNADILHTVTSRSGVPQGFDSGRLDTKQSFAKTFTKPGRYSYMCTLHPGLMEGVIQVGADTTDPKLSKLKAKKSSKSVKLSFSLSENAKLAVAIKRGSKKVKTLKTKTLDQGSGSVTYKSRKALAAGSYKASLVATDVAGNKARASTVSFKVK